MSIMTITDIFHSLKESTKFFTVRSAMETNFKLPQKYVDLGFNISKFGKNSLALRFQDKIVFVFSSGIDVRDDFISRLCDCHLKIDSNTKVLSRN